MIRLIHCMAYLLVAIVAAGGLLCIWAVAESRKPGVSGEVLMAVPGASFLMMLPGWLLLACLVVAGRDMAALERPILWAVAGLGILLFPTLLALGV